MEATTMDTTATTTATAATDSGEARARARAQTIEAVAADVATRVATRDFSPLREQYEDGSGFALGLVKALVRGRGWVESAEPGSCNASTFERVVVSPDGTRALRLTSACFLGAFTIVEWCPMPADVARRVRWRIELHDDPRSDVTPAAGPAYVCRPGSAWDGGWRTREARGALTWKTERGARRWLAERPEIEKGGHVQVARFVR